MVIAKLPVDSPAVLSGAPRALLGHFDLDRTLLAALTAARYASPYGPIIALHHVGVSLAAAKVQQRRITRARRSVPGRRFKGNASLFADIHFYLISCSRIAKLARSVSGWVKSSPHATFRRTTLVLKKHRLRLDKMIAARDHLEHIEERVPGQPKHHLLKVPSDLLNLAGDHLTFGGEQFDIGPSSLTWLLLFVKEFRLALLFDAIDLLADQDRKGLEHVVRDAVSRLRLAGILKQSARISIRRIQSAV